MPAEISNVGKLILIGRVESPMHSNNNPFDTRVVSCIHQILLQETVLVGSQLVGMLGGEVYKVSLTIVEGEEKVGLSWELTW